MTMKGNAGEFDAGEARRELLRAVVIAFVMTAAALAGIVFLLGREEWWRGYTAATVAGALAAGLSLVPLWKGLGKGMSAMVPAVMAATAVRTAAALGGCVLGIVAAHDPAVPTLALVVPYYVALLWIESATLVNISRAVTQRKQQEKRL